MNEGTAKGGPLLPEPLTHMGPQWSRTEECLSDSPHHASPLRWGSPKMSQSIHKILTTVLSGTGVSLNE